MKKITQVEARRLRKRVDELEKILQSQRNAWLKEWPEGVHLCSSEVTPIEEAIVTTARRLRHAVVVTQVNRGKVEFYACEVPE